MSLLDDEEVLIKDQTNIKQKIDNDVYNILYIPSTLQISNMKDPIEIWHYNNGYIEVNDIRNPIIYDNDVHYIQEIIPTVFSKEADILMEEPMPDKMPILAFKDSFTKNNRYSIPGLNREYNTYNIRTLRYSIIDINTQLKDVGILGIKFPKAIDKMYYLGPICYNGSIQNSENIQFITSLYLLGRNTSNTDLNLLSSQFMNLKCILDLYITGTLFLNNERPIKNLPIDNIILQSDLGRYEGMAAFDYGPIEGRFIHMAIDEFVIKLGYLMKGRNIKDITKIHDIDTFKILSLIHMLNEFFKNNPNVKNIYYKDLSIKQLIYDYSKI